MFCIPSQSLRIVLLLRTTNIVNYYAFLPQVRGASIINLNHRWCVSILDQHPTRGYPEIVYWLVGFHRDRERKGDHETTI